MKWLLSIILTAVVLSAKSNGEFIIGNGSPAKVGEFPFQARVRSTFPEPYQGGRLCGGNLINDQWVLTASHCLREQGKRVVLVQVQLGVIENLDINNETGSVTQYTDNFFLHPKSFSNGMVDFSHDLGLIHLPTPVTFSKTIQPIKMANRNAGGFVGKSAVVSGWGMTNEKPVPSNKLIFTSMTVITNNECALSYGVKVFMNKNIICTKPINNSGACDGDSGGPLAIGSNSDDRTLIGVVAFKSPHRACKSSVPRGFVAVSTHRDWIREHAGI